MPGSPHVYNLHSRGPGNEANIEHDVTEKGPEFSEQKRMHAAQSSIS